MKAVLMKCGHAAQATDSDGNPACVICAVLDPNARVVDENPPDLNGRVARCAYFDRPIRNNACPVCRDAKPDRFGQTRCACERPSSVDLAFFEHRTNAPRDVFYCGCHSWS